MDRPFIKFDNVTINTAGGLCFQDTNLVMEYGQNWAVTGPTGSGKSLLINAILHKTGLFRGQILYYFDDGPEGRPYLCKNDVLMISPETQGQILQKYGGYHQARWQSFGSDDVPNVKEFLSGKNIEHISPYEVTPLKTAESVYEKRRKETLDLLQIGRLSDSRLIYLSNGEMRKVLLARALIQCPKLLIIDDPYYGLDSSSMKVLEEIINNILAAGSPKLLLVMTDYEDIPENITHTIEIGSMKVLKADIKRKASRKAAVFTGKVPVIHPADESGGRYSSEILVEMKNVNISYGERHILKNISWVIRRGENWALLGHNGAGKTTLLSLILGDNPQAYSNEIYLFGRKRGTGESIWDIKSRIGWVSSELQYYYETRRSCLDVVSSGFFDTIGMFGTVDAGKAGASKSWMDALGIGQIRDKDFESSSIGEQRLVLLARALVKKPDLVVLDEPCQGLDSSHIGIFNSLVEELCTSGLMSAIYVTHKKEEIPGCFRLVLELRDGRVEKSGAF